MAEVKLLGHMMSPFVFRVAIALHLKKVDYKLVKVEVHGQKSEILLRSNPVYKKIPVLIHQDKSICESAIILEYIDEAWTGGPTLLPVNPSDRAQARFWTAYIDDKLPPLMRSLRGTTDVAAKVGIAERVAQVLQPLEEIFAKCSEGKGFFGGDAIGYLDVAVGCYFGWLKMVGRIPLFADVKLLDEEKVPLLVAWADRFLRDDVVKEVMPKMDEFEAYAKIISTGLNVAK